MATKLAKPATKEPKVKPVGGGLKDKPKGNPAALAKAREARVSKTSELKLQKIKVLNKDHGARAGSNRAAMLDIVLKAKTVGEAIDNGASMVDVRFAEKSDFISIG